MLPRSFYLGETGQVIPDTNPLRTTLRPTMRNSMRKRLRPPCWLLWVTLSAVSGCGSSDDLSSPTAVRMRALANFYLDYAIPKNGKGPGGEQVFKEHIRSLPDFLLRQNGVEPDEIEAMFVSERDHEPLVINYGLTITRISGKSGVPVAHEKTGKNGKRLVVLSNCKVELADEARLQELMAEKQ